MKYPPFSSLRSRLFLLVLLAILPALGLILYTASEQRQTAAAEGKADALRLARVVATDQERLVDEARQLLITLAHLPDASGNNPAACSRLLAELLLQYPQYANLGVISPTGEVRCSAYPLPQPGQVNDRSYFQQALQNPGLVAGDYRLDSLTGRTTVDYAYAINNSAGESTGVIFASLDLAWLNRLVAEAQLPDQAVLVEIDPTGKVVLHHPETDQWIGETLPNLPLTQLMIAQGEGTAEVAGPDGIPRLYAFTPVHYTPQTNLYVAIGLSREAVFADADRLFMRYLLSLGIVALLTLAAAWWGGEIFVLRRVHDLLVATQRLEAGDLQARTGIPYGQGELSQLARAFDQMTAALEQRENERQQAEQEVTRYARDLAALNTTLTAISSSLEQPEILANLKKELVDQMNIPGGIILFYDEEDGCLYLEAAWGVPPAVLTALKRFPANFYHYREVIESHQPFLKPDFRQVVPYAGSGLAEIRPGWQGYLSLPLLAKGEVQGVIDLFGAGPDSFNPDLIPLYSTLGQQVGVMLQNARLFAQVRSGRQRLQILSQELLEVQERERRHISRELHDEIGQALTALKVNLQAVLRLSGASTNSRYVEESIGIIQRVLQQVRDLSLDLRPSLLDDLGVVAALRWYIDRQGQRAGFKTEFIASPPEMRLPANLETVCFRVVQEALTNVVRHAVASLVEVHITLQANELELLIRDNGIGFNVSQVRERTSGDMSLGLLGMQERVQLVGGHFEIQSDPDRGTEIRATFPISVVANFQGKGG